MNDRERVLEAADIVGVVGDHVALRGKGREFVGLCPFHDDANPSMYVVPHKGIFHCFACGAGGNAIDFVMKFHGMDFRSALAMLAERSGVELTGGRPRREDDGDDATGVGAINAANVLAMRLYRTLLAHPEHGRAARAVLAARGVDDDTAKAFGLGASPDRWDGLLSMASKEGLGERTLVAAGLAKSRETGGCYDAFRHRLMFPIVDQLGRPIAFGGRRLREEDNPKYLNSPESKVFDKSSTIYGLKQAMPAIKQAGLAIVCEGYMDVIACYGAGVRHVVATLGTAFTPGHARQLRRICSTVVLLFDGDEAGLRAAERAVEVCFAEPIDVRVAVLPGGRDPDDLLREPGGRAAFDELIEHAVDAIEFRYDRLQRALLEAGHARGSAGWSEAIEQEARRLAEMGFRRLPLIRMRAILDRLEKIAGVPRSVIADVVDDSARRRGRGASAAGAAEVARFCPSSAVERSLGCLLSFPQLCRMDPGGVEAALAEARTRPGVVASLASVIAGLIGEVGEAPADRVVAAATAPEVRQLAARLSSWADQETDREARPESWASRIEGLWRDSLKPSAPPSGRDPIEALREFHAHLGRPRVPVHYAMHSSAPSQPQQEHDVDHAAPDS